MGRKGLNGRVLLDQPSKSLPKTISFFSMIVFYYHMDTKHQKVGDVFCFICLYQFLTDVHPVEPENTVVSAYVGRRGKSVPGASNIAQWNRNWNFARKVQSLFTHRKIRSKFPCYHIHIKHIVVKANVASKDPLHRDLSTGWWVRPHSHLNFSDTLTLFQPRRVDSDNNIYVYIPMYPISWIIKINIYPGHLCWHGISVNPHLSPLPVDRWKQ